jgi:hypothetical protein
VKIKCGCRESSNEETRQPETKTKEVTR